MLLRKATEKDFSEFKVLYANSNFHWLYASENLNPTPEQEKEAKEILYEMGIEQYMIQKIADEYQSYSYDKFLKSKNEHLFLIESGSTVVGYISILYHQGEIKIHEWAMRYTDFNVIQETLKLMKQQFRGKTLHVNITNNYAENVLERLGFHKMHGITYGIT